MDSSSGAIGTAVNRAIEEIVPVIAGAPAEAETREMWLERLWKAHAKDEIPYIELLADHWGELCASKEVASAWTDELVGITRMALSPDRSVRGHFRGATACLSALYRAERYEELVDVLQTETLWPYKRWAVKAFGAMRREAYIRPRRGGVQALRTPHETRDVSRDVPSRGETVPKQGAR